jgi:hypothetical protein
MSKGVEMDARLSTIRNLLYILIALVLLSSLAGFYVATELARNSDELASLQVLLQREVFKTALTHAQELETQLDSLNQSAAGIDDKLKKAQDDLVARMQVELPKILDDYVKQRGSLVQQKMQQRGIPVPH